MAALVPSSELGLYAVAVTVSSITFALGAAVSGAIYPRVAAGDGHARRARRAASRCCSSPPSSVVLAIVTPWLVPFMFGEEFRDAVPMALVLLASSVPAAATIVVTAALTAANEPAAPMRAELITLALTASAARPAAAARTAATGAAVITLVGLHAAGHAAAALGAADVRAQRVELRRRRARRTCAGSGRGARQAQRRRDRIRQDGPVEPLLVEAPAGAAHAPAAARGSAASSTTARA